MADGDRLRPLQVRVAGHRRLRLGVRRGRAARARERGDRQRAPRRPRPRRRAGTPPRPGRSASGRRGSCGRPRRAGARSRCGRPRHSGSIPPPVAISASRDSACASSASSRMPAACRRRAWIAVACAVVRQQLGVVGAQERGRRRVERAPDPPRPEAHAFVFARLRAAASSTSSDAILTKPSAAACGNVSPVPYEASCSA